MNALSQAPSGMVPSRRSAWMACCVALLLVTVGCTGATPSAAPPSGDAAHYRVVTTTSVLADLARLALGPSATVTSIVPAGVDVHTFEPSPSDVRSLAQANLVLANGLGLDGWVTPLLDAAGVPTKALLLLGEGLDASAGWSYLPGGTGTSGAHDPHIWMDPRGAALYVQRIAARATIDDPADAAAIATASGAGLASITALDAQIAAGFAEVASKQIVTFHDAFGYFARAYGITVVGVAVASPGQDPSAKEIAALITAIRATGVRAIFSEAQLPAKVLEQIARDSGAKVLGGLYSDALGLAPADSYLGLMRFDAAAILTALGGRLK